MSLQSSSPPALASLARQQAPPQLRAARGRADAAFIKQYCLACHNARANAGGLALDALNPANVGGHAEQWEKVVRKLRTELCRRTARPSRRRPLGRLLRRSRSRARRGGRTAIDPGAPALHRLNRTEYGNAIRDLLALDVDVSALLPPDDSTAGFDNIADVLGVSPALIEGYVAAAAKISRLAVGDPSIGLDRVVYRVPGDLSQDTQLEGLPHRNTRRDRRSPYVPARRRVRHSGRASRWWRTAGRSAAGCRRARRWPVRGDRRRSHPGAGARRHADPRIGGASHHSPRPWRGNPDSRRRRRLRHRGARARYHADRHCRPAQPGGSWRHAEPPAAVRLHAGVRRGRGAVRAQDAVDAPDPRVSPTGRGERTRTPDAARVLSRRPRTGTFDAGIQRALARVLVDPSFLFRFEREPATVAPGAAYRLSDLELASRLSFFLWSSIPDDELIAVAARARSRTRRCSSSRSGGCSRIRAPTPSSPTSPGNGCFCAS